MNNTKILQIIFVIFFISLSSLCNAEDGMSPRWKSMSDRERESYALGIRDALAVMCRMTSENQDKFMDCINEFVQKEDFLSSMKDIFDKAYVKNLYTNIPSDMLIHLWLNRDEGNMDTKLKEAEELSIQLRKKYNKN